MEYILQISVLLFSVIIHEVAHGFVAYKRGDDTAKIMGRLTLNPVVHIDIFGSIVLPLLLLIANAPVFGWAKPVPVNFYKLNNPKTDMVWVSLAGCLANFMLAVMAGLGMFLIRTFGSENISILISVYSILKIILIINIILPLLNLIPIPPLDGSRVFVYLLPRDMAIKYMKIEPYGFLIIFALLATGILWTVISPVAYFLIALLS
ncbi:MAG: site-2 protease family protein [Endomicrobiaceae bacterium]|jgi:Zn-dependent protease|nr:site-2 protease family protein [Endomicrobiaceae bacterium]